jgi:hypothetical protein
VIFGEVDSLPLPAEDRTGITCIRNKISGGRDEDHVGCTSHCRTNKLSIPFTSLFLFTISISYFVEFALPLRALDKFIDQFEGFVEGLLVLLILVGIGFLELFLEDLAHILADFKS